MNSVKKQIKRWRWQLRMLSRNLSAASRVLPDFVIVGAQKAGTTSFYSLLCQHPQIAPALKKEVHYFDQPIAIKNTDYRSYFPRKSEMEEGMITGEASPYYMAHPLVAQRMSESVPNVQLLFLLRNPVDRAISHYFHETRKGREKLPILEAFAAEEERMKGQVEQLLADPTSSSYNHNRCSFRMRGCYADHIERFLNYYPKEQMLFLFSEEWFPKPEAGLHQAFEWLGVDPDFVPSDTKPQNIGTYSGKVPEELVDELQSYFLPYNKRLSELLGRDLPW